MDEVEGEVHERPGDERHDDGGDAEPPAEQGARQNGGELEPALGEPHRPARPADDADHDEAVA